MIGEWSDSAKVSAVESQDGIGSELGGDGDIHGVGEVEFQSAVVSSNGLRRVEDVGRYLGQDCAARPHPVPDVVDRLVGGVGPKDTPRHVVEFAE